MSRSKEQRNEARIRKNKEKGGKKDKPQNKKAKQKDRT